MKLDKIRVARVFNGLKESVTLSSRFDQSWWTIPFVKVGLAQFTRESKECNSVMYKNFIHVDR